MALAFQPPAQPAYGAPPPMMGGASSPPDPNVIDAEFYDLMVKDEEASLMPEPPPWYVPQRAPSLAEMIAEAQDQKQRHSERILASAFMDLRLGNEIGAIFNADELFVRMKEIEPQVSPMLRWINDAIVNFIATQTIQFTSLATGLVHREEQAAIETHLADSIDDVKQRHYREGWGSFLRTVTSDALKGLVALYHAPDPSNERTGQRIYRVDPNVVFPIFGRDGLDAVYVVYEANVTEMFRDYGDGPDGPVTNAITKIARKGKGRGNAPLDLKTCYEFVGRWDRENVQLTWNKEPIKEEKHNLWVCPWHIGRPNWRQVSGSRASQNMEWSWNRPPLDADGTPLIGTSYERDLARAYEPFLKPWISVIDAWEKSKTRITYGLDRALQQPKVHKVSQQNATDGGPEVANYRDGTTQIGEDEELDVLPMNPINDSFTPWMEMMQVEMQAAIPSVIFQGQQVGAQASGNSIDAIIEMGLGMFAPVPEFIQLLLTDVGHRDLTYIRDWSPTFGTLSVPQHGAYGADPSLLTKEMLGRAGCYVECTLNRFNLAAAQGKITSASIANLQLGIGTDEYWIKQLGMSAHPRQLIEDRRYQDMEKSEDFAKPTAVRELYRQMERAQAMGDEKSLREIMITAKRVVWLQTIDEMLRAQMAGILPDPGMEEVPPGGQPGAQPGQPTMSANPMPALSAPAFGRETGMQGGAPMAPAIPGQVP